MKVNFFLRNKYILILACVGLVLALRASASLEDVVYPVVELGNCASKDECFTYCGDPTNYDACIEFADSNAILEEKEIQKYRQVQETIAQGGPGGCITEAECKSYCDDLNHTSECITFAQENGLMDEAQLAEAQKVLSAIESGHTPPGGCGSKESCDAYCSQPANMDECLNFAEAAGFMSGDELAQAKNMMNLMQSGQTPGGCITKDECDSYCQGEDHFDECLDFGVKSGFMSQDEAEKMRMVGKEGPGGCSSKEECDAFCGDPANTQTCTTFAVEAGMMSEKDAQMMQQMNTKEFMGPGGCNSKETCELFCSQEGNQDSCASFFGKPSEQMQRNEMDGEGQDRQMREGFVGPGGCTSKETCETFCADGANSEACSGFISAPMESENRMDFDQEFMPEEGEFRSDVEGGVLPPVGEPLIGEPPKDKMFQYGQPRDFQREPMMFELKEGSVYEGQYEFDYDYKGNQKIEEGEMWLEPGSDFENFNAGEFELKFGPSPSEGSGGYQRFEGSQKFNEGIQVMPNGTWGGERSWGGDMQGSESGFGGRGGGGGSQGGGPGGEGGGGEMPGGGGAAPGIGGGEQGLGPSIDAGFVESLKRFLYRAGLRTKGVMLL